MPYWIRTEDGYIGRTVMLRRIWDFIKRLSVRRDTEVKVIRRDGDSETEIIVKTNER